LFALLRCSHVPRLSLLKIVIGPIRTIRVSAPGKWRSRPFDRPAFTTDFKSTRTLFTRVEQRLWANNLLRREVIFSVGAFVPVMTELNVNRDPTLLSAQPMSQRRSEEHTSELQSRGQLVCR